MDDRYKIEIGLRQKKARGQIKVRQLCKHTYLQESKITRRWLKPKAITLQSGWFSPIRYFWLVFLQFIFIPFQFPHYQWHAEDHFQCNMSSQLPFPVSSTRYHLSSKVSLLGNTRTKTTTIMVIAYFEESPASFRHVDWSKDSKYMRSQASQQKIGENPENLPKILKKTYLKKLRERKNTFCAGLNFPTKKEDKQSFVQGSDLELLYWEAANGKRVDWDDVSRYHLEILSPNGDFLSLRKFKQESSTCLPQIGLGK